MGNTNQTKNHFFCRTCCQCLAVICPKLDHLLGLRLNNSLMTPAPSVHKNQICDCLCLTDGQCCSGDLNKTLTYSSDTEEINSNDPHGVLNTIHHSRSGTILILQLSSVCPYLGHFMSKVWERSRRDPSKTFPSTIGNTCHYSYLDAAPILVLG